MTWDDEADRAIDAVARRMTAGELPAAFTSRVLAELRAPRRRWRSARWTLTVAPVAAALAIVVAASVVLPRWRASHSGPAVGPPSQGRDLALDRGPASRLARSSPEPTLAPVHDSPTSWAIAPPLSERGLNASGINPLAPPPIEVDSIALSEISHGESIQIPRLDSIQSIRLTPLAEGDRP
jgi:hypothetical protein